LAQLSSRIEDYLRRLTTYPDRHVGGEGNRAATALFAEAVAAYGFTVKRTVFDCLEWEFGDASVVLGEQTYPAFPGPYSYPCDVAAGLVVARTSEELESRSFEGSALLLLGEIAAHQVMPKNFRFYNPEEHQRIIKAIEQGRPAVVLGATGRDAEMVGSQYPFPLFEDGDLEVPNAYMADVDGESLARSEGEVVRVRVDSHRIPSHAEHVVAVRAGSGSGRIVVSAHIDSRKGSPGGLDNASGVATLLGMAELLAGYDGERSIELVPFNGEDNYANPGEIMWLDENDGRFGDIVLGINVDDSGQRGSLNHVSFYDCPPDLGAIIRDSMTRYPRVEEGPKWVQGDHMVFLMNSVPAIALASSTMHEFMAAYAHTDRDTAELADPELIAESATFLAEVVRGIGRASDAWRPAE